MGKESGFLGSKKSCTFSKLGSDNPSISIPGQQDAYSVISWHNKGTYSPSKKVRAIRSDKKTGFKKKGSMSNYLSKDSTYQIIEEETPVSYSRDLRSKRLSHNPNSRSFNNLILEISGSKRLTNEINSATLLTKKSEAS